MADYRKIRASTWRSWLSGLPDEIYDKSDTSHIVRLMDALCGDNGVGYLRKRLLLKRLQTSLYETRYGDLDVVYSSVFGLRRLKSEEYGYSTDSLLLWSEIQEMNIKDAHYRQRIWDYMMSFQYGGTAKGLALAAQAATGIPCEVVDGCVYYRSCGVEWMPVPDGQDDSYRPAGEDGMQGFRSNEAINFDRTVDFDGVTIVVMTDGELTPEQQLNLSTVTSRLRPVDVHYTFMTRSELMGRLRFSDIDDEWIVPEVVEESSHWWNVVRTVTGRPDWGHGVRGNEWIEPNVAKEAPQQLLMNSQESSYDFTPMVRSSYASSVHVGRYNARQREVFESLGTRGAEIEHVASSALTQASSRMVSMGYYGDLMVMDGTYPIAYADQFTPFSAEEGRSHRFWSSDERDGDEWIVFTLRRAVPINHVSMNVFRKPARYFLEFSSSLDDDGEPIWRSARTLSGIPISFTSREFGCAGGGEMVSVDFDVITSVADAVRIRVERVDIERYVNAPDGSVMLDDAKLSVEISDVSIGLVVRSESDFEPMSYDDMFGNRVDTSLRVLGAENAVDGDDSTYWLSQPNVGESAVEYLVLKVADEPVRVNFVEFDAVYAGCQLNIYSTEDEEPVEWYPYPQTYTLRSGRIELPMRKVRFLKLEFTSLSAIPYDIAVGNAPVSTRRFPWSVRDYNDSRFGVTDELSQTQQLLVGPSYGGPGDGSVRNRLGIEEGYIVDDGYRDPFFSEAVPLGYLTRNSDFRAYQDSVIGETYGDDMAVEQTPIVPKAGTTEGPNPYYSFREVGRHEYEVRDYVRTEGLAYVVGIKDVRLGFTGKVFSATPNDTFMLYMHDGRFIAENDGWEYADGERLKVSNSSRLNRFETVDMQSVYPFRTFEFAVNQKPAVEKFEYPSDMVKEWHGVNAEVEPVEFGTSGTVMKITPDSAGGGIDSELKLTRSMAIANVQVDVFPFDSGRWELSCHDLFGEEVFKQRYELDAGRWNTIGANFVPEPGGSWWDRDYPYRLMLDVKGPLSKGSSVFVPVVDFDALVQAKMIDAGLTKLRLVFFDGVSCEEIPVDITDNMELWFPVMQELPANVSANAEYDYGRGEFNGAYYIYFGGSAAADRPIRDFRKVFHPEPYRLLDGDADGDYQPDENGGGIEFTGERRLEADTLTLPDTGFISFEASLLTPLRRVPEGEVDTAEVRFFLDYEDDDKKVQLYSYEAQLVFVIRENDGFENSFVTKEENVISAQDEKSHVIVEWWPRGSADVWEANESNIDKQINCENKNRRRIEMYVDSATKLECIDNVYDEHWYMDTDKRY